MIIFVAQRETLGMVVTCLNTYSMRNYIVADTWENCVSNLERRPDAMLILDWRGWITVNVLNISKGDQVVDLRPILLLVEKSEPGLINILTEYTIPAVQVGPFEPEVMLKRVRSLLEDDHPYQVCKAEFLKVAEFRQQRNFIDAEDLLMRLHQKFPGNYKIQTELAANYLDLKLEQDCENIIDSILQVNDQIPRALYLKAKCLLKRKEIQKAADFLDNSILYNPLHPQRLVELGENLLILNNPTAAREKFNKARKMVPDDPRANMGCSSVEFLLGNHNEALNFLQNLKSEKDKAAVFNNTGVMCVRKKQMALAFKLYDLGIKMVKDDIFKSRILFNKSLAYFRVGNEEESLKVIKTALKLNPNLEKAQRLMRRISGELVGHSGEDPDDQYVDLNEMGGEASDAFLDEDEEIVDDIIEDVDIMNFEDEKL